VSGSDQGLASLEDEFLGYALAQAHPMLRQWRGAALEADLREATAASLRTFIVDAEAQRVADTMRVLALPAASYQGRLIDMGGVRSIAHIDFPDPSGDFPFVKIKGASEPPGSIAEWHPLAKAINGAFAQFRPRAVYFFHPAHLPLRAPEARVDTYLVAAPAGGMAGRPDAPGLDRVELRRATGLAFYPEYEAAYEQMLAERPYLRDEIEVESRDDLAECLEEGLLFEVLVDGVWGGLIAAERDLVAGLRGLVIEEIVLARAARGQGLGPAVHQRFARAMAANDPATVILGTIAAKNAPSLRTAGKAGRLEIGAWYWIDLP
jgi:L-amino acid N-acyltransferase YncA